MGRWQDDVLNIVGSFHSTFCDADGVKDTLKEAVGHFPAGELVLFIMCIMIV